MAASLLPATASKAVAVFGLLLLAAVFLLSIAAGNSINLHFIELNSFRCERRRGRGRGEDEEGGLRPADGVPREARRPHGPLQNEIK